MLAVPKIREYVTQDGRSPFGRWFNRLAHPAALKVRVALSRLEVGNTSALKSVGQGVHEIRIDSGPGYRVYLGMDGDDLVILLGGSTKTRQSDAIADAHERWNDHKRRKRQGER